MSICIKQNPVIRLLFINVLLFNSNLIIAQAPTVSGFTPTTVCQGDAVTITGTNFTGATDVKINGNSAINFKVVSATSITATVSYTATTGKVSVITPSGIGNSSSDLLVKPAPQPSLTDKSPDVDIPFTNCNGISVYTLTVQNSSIAAGGSCNYDIDWGDGSAHFTQTNWPSGSQTPHTYLLQGYFIIKLSITPANGCTKSFSQKFYNGVNPLASLTTTAPTTGLCAPAAITFKIGNWFNNSPGTVYTLDFGDASAPVVLQHPLNLTNTDELVSHTYTTSSCPFIDFTAKLNASNACYVTTYTLNQIIVRIKPDAKFAFDNTPHCGNEEICFNNETTNGYSGTNCSSATSYNWNFGDGVGTSNEVNPCYHYSKAGTYTVTMTAANTGCGGDITSQTITIQNLSPVPAVSASPVAYCQGAPAGPLTATGLGLLWYTTATGGTGSVAAPTPPTNNAGTFTYYVSQTLSGYCESPRVPVVVIVYALPGKPVVSTPVNLCKGQPASPLTATGQGLLWYPTATGGTGSPTAPTPSTVNVGTTNYYVSQTVNNCEGSRAEIVVQVSTIPAMPVVITPVNYCQNQPASPLQATGTKLLWYTTATGGSGSSAAPVPSTAMPGTITYYVSQSTNCGESPRAPISVVVKPGPSATISYDKTVLCNAANTASNPNPPINVKLTGTTGGTFSSTPSGLVLNSSTGTITPYGSLPGNYIITYKVVGTGGCSDFSTSTGIVINGTPTATVSYPLICSSDATISPVFSGSKGGLFTSTAGLVLNASTGVITPLNSLPGNYVVNYTLQPSAPCPGFVTSANVSITKAPSATITYNPSLLCNVVNSSTTPNPPVNVTFSGTTGGTYTVLPATGLPVNATSGQINPSGATPGLYTIIYTVNASGGCKLYTVKTTITVNGTPSAGIAYPGSPFCNSINILQQAFVTGSKGGTYSSTPGLFIDANTGAINPSLSKPGTYTVAYTIAASPPCPGFVTSTKATIIESPVLTFTVLSQSVCSGNTAFFYPVSTVSNSVYTWSVVGNLPAGVSGATSGTATGPNAVIPLAFTNTSSISQTITVQVLPTNPSSKPCNGAPFNLSLKINPIPAKLKVDTVEYCMHTPASPLVVNADAGNTVNWYDKNNNLLNSAPVINTNAPAIFIYYVSQTNVYGCESPKAQQVAVVNPTAKIISSLYINPTQCGLPTGFIRLKVVDLNNNPITGIPVIVHYTKFQTLYAVSAVVNGNGNITLALVAGTYSDIYVESFGCLSQKIPDVFVLKDPNPPGQPLAGYNSPLCSEHDLIFSASSPTSSQTGAIDYIWVGPAFGAYADTVKNTVVTFPSAPSSYAGDYIVYAIQNNCISLPSTFPVEIKQSPSKPQIVTKTPLCIGDALTLQAYSSVPDGSALNFVWNGPAAGFPVNISYASVNSVSVENSGIYTITVTSPQTGCSLAKDTLVQVGGYPIVKFMQDSLTVPTGYILSLSTSVINASEPNILPIAKYEWLPLQDIICNDAICSQPTVTIKDNACYSVKATNIYGCSGGDTLCVNVFCKSSQVFLPNAFTPNGNIAANTRFTIRASGIASVKSFRIFNRWGRIVFERNNVPPNDASYGWDGRMNGKLADAGVYVYVVDVICENNIPYSYKGNVTLIK